MDKVFHKRGPSRRALLAALLCTLLLPGGCAYLDLGENLPRAILNHPDPATVRTAMPSYMLMVDGLLLDDPDHEGNLRTAAKLYTSYAALFAEEPEQARRLSTRAREYGNRALCERNGWTCGIEGWTLERIEGELGGFTESDLPMLHTFSAAWLVWIKVHADDWNAVADLPKVQTLLEHCVTLDETYDTGNGHLYLGLLHSARPPALGGDAEAARAHFERAIELSGGTNLSAKVAYAQSYARMLYDRGLHDRLLTEVLEAAPEAQDMTLSNTMARERARELMASADDYF